jgi:hypothetical protein
MAFAIVNGTVQRTFFDGKGASVVETFQKRDGTEGKSYYTAFFDAPHGLSEGSTGKFSGLLSAKAREYEDKEGNNRVTADIVLNSARFEADNSAEDDSPF